MVADQGLSQAEQSESSTDSCADSTGHRTRCAPQDFFEGDRAHSPTPSDEPLPVDHQVREAICRDIWVRLNLRAEVNNPDFMVPECRNQDCTRPEQNCCAWASLCPGFNNIEEFIDDAIQDRAMVAILIPDWPEESWYKTVMAYQKKKYFYSGDREVLEDMPATDYGWWAVLVDTNKKPNWHIDDRKRVRNKSAERRWRRKFKQVVVC